MEPTQYIWHNGNFVRWDDAKTHVLTHTLHYGCGAFEGIRAYMTDKGPAVFRLQDHVDRLFFSAQSVGIRIPFDDEKIKNSILNIVKLNNLDSCYIRPIVFLGYGIMGVNPDKAPVNVSVACWAWGKYIQRDMVSLKVSSYRRHHPDTTVSGAKLSGNYLNSVLAVREAKEKRYDEALLLDVNGFVAEGSAENFFMLKDSVMYTPKLGSILPGITRATIIEIATKMGIQVREVDIRPEETLDADEAFFTGTAAEVSPIGMIEDTAIGDGTVGPITRRLKETYINIVHGRIAEYRRYLSYVNDAKVDNQAIAAFGTTKGLRPEVLTSTDKQE